jgi:hypothetical protein
MFIFKNISTYSVSVYCITRQYAKKSPIPETNIPELFQNVDVMQRKLPQVPCSFILKRPPVPYLFIYVIANSTHVSRDGLCTKLANCYKLRR